MLLTLMMNIKMLGPQVPIETQLIEFDSKLDGDINVGGSETEFDFDSKPTLSI